MIEEKSTETNQVNDVVNSLILVSIKAEKVRVLFNLLLESLNLNPRSSRKEFFDAMIELHEKEQEAQKQLGLLQAREAMANRKATQNKGKKGSLSVSN